MDFDGNYKVLGKVDHVALRDAVLALKPIAWQEDEIRQQKFTTAHIDTESIMLLWCQGWEPHQVVKKSGCVYLGDEVSTLVDELMENHYPDDGEFLRIFIAKLKPGGTIPIHRDSHPSFAISHRIHVPLRTSQDVIFNINNKQVVMEEGIGYEINNLKSHEVFNNGTEDRIHLIIDYVPPK